MVVETIKYMDFDGNERSDTVYFNLTKAECMELELVTEGGLQKYLEKIVADNDNEKIVMFFKNLLMKAYGEKSADGKYFRKSPERSENFVSTEAYSELFMHLISDADYMKSFVTNMLPVDYRPDDNQISAAMEGKIQLPQGND